MQIAMIVALGMIVPSFFTLLALVGIGGGVSGGEPADIQLLTITSMAALFAGIGMFILAYELVEVRAILEEEKEAAKS
jgi:hypothetical protein